MKINNAWSLMTRAAETMAMHMATAAGLDFTTARKIRDLISVAKTDETHPFADMDDYTVYMPEFIPHAIDDDDDDWIWDPYVDPGPHTCGCDGPSLCNTHILWALLAHEVAHIVDYVGFRQAQYGNIADPVVRDTDHEARLAVVDNRKLKPWHTLITEVYINTVMLPRFASGPAAFHRRLFSGPAAAGLVNWAGRSDDEKFNMVFCAIMERLVTPEMRVWLAHDTSEYASTLRALLNTIVQLGHENLLDPPVSSADRCVKAYAFAKLADELVVPASASHDSRALAEKLDALGLDPDAYGVCCDEDCEMCAPWRSETPSSIADQAASLSDEAQEMIDAIHPYTAIELAKVMEQAVMQEHAPSDSYGVGPGDADGDATGPKASGGDGPSDGFDLGEFEESGIETTSWKETYGH